MKQLNEQTNIEAGKSTSLMIFIELAYFLEKQRGTLSVAFPELGNRGLFRLLRKLVSNPIYTQNKEELLGISERFFNNTSLRSLYKTLAFLDSKNAKADGDDNRIQDINRVLSKIERMITSKLTSQEKQLFSSFEPTIQKYGDNLNSLLSSVSETPPTEEPTPDEEPKPEEKPVEKPEPTEPQKDEPSTEPSVKKEPEDTEKPNEKKKTEEQFKSLIKRLVKETLVDYEKKFGKL